MLRPGLFLLIALPLAALPPSVTAQSGKCQKKSQQTSQVSQRTPGYAQPPASYAQPAPYPSTTQTSTRTTPAQGLQYTTSMLKTLVAQLKSYKVDSPATQALNADLKTVQQLAQNSSLSGAKKDEQILDIMEKVLADLQALANESSLPTQQQSALTELTARYTQLGQTAQDNSQLATRGR